MGRFDTYSGMVTAFPYAFRQSDSRLFRSYVVVSTLVGALVAVLMANALVVLVGNTASAPGGSLTLSRTFYIVVGLFVFLPVVAPVLFVAHRYRRERRVAERYDAALAASGYVFVASLYLALVVSTPAEYRDAGAGPVADFLYSLPTVAGAVPPVLAAAAVYLVHRHYGSKHGNGETA